MIRGHIKHKKNEEEKKTTVKKIKNKKKNPKYGWDRLPFVIRDADLVPYSQKQNTET